MSGTAFFDMDGTLLRGESQFSFLLWCWRRGIISGVRASPVVFRYGAYLAGFRNCGTALRERGLQLFEGRRCEDVRTLARDFFTRCLVRRVRQEAAALIHAHRERGDRIVLVTSAIMEIALIIADHLHIESIIATRLQSVEGVFTGGCESPAPYSVGKRELVAAYCASHGVERCDAWAYADHVSDLPLLEYVGHPVVVNPSGALRAVATQRQWKVLRLR